ncbi:hypothetical protein Tco_0000908 [Tanacetum coccineum]
MITKRGRRLQRYDLQLIMCGDIVKDSNSYLKSRGSIEDFVSFREMITSQLQGKLWLYDEVHEQIDSQHVVSEQVALDLGFIQVGFHRFIFLIVRNGGKFEYWKAELEVVVVSEQDELPSSIGLDFRARLDGGQMYSGYLEAKRLP